MNQFFTSTLTTELISRTETRNGVYNHCGLFLYSTATIEHCNIIVSFFPASISLHATLSISMQELYEWCVILRVNKKCNLPSLLAIGLGIHEVVDGLKLRDGGTALACPEGWGGLSLEDTVCSVCLSKPPAQTVKEELLLTTIEDVHCSLLRMYTVTKKVFMRHDSSC